MSELILPGDKYNMNWIEGTHAWGECFSKHPLTVGTESVKKGNRIYESFTFTNNTAKTIVSSPCDIGIYATFNDNYDNAKTCVSGRCHTHIFCGGNVSYVMALRMGGDPPHLGLYVTEGAIYGYSVDRNLALQSNDRGDFILHPEGFILAPGESYTLRWVLFPHRGEVDFYKKISKFKNYINVSAEKYIVERGDNIKLKIKPAFGFTRKDIKISACGEMIKFICKKDEITVNYPAESVGEIRFDIEISGIKTYAIVFSTPDFSTLVKNRREFIVKNQQVDKPGDMLHGAYMPYDNETGYIVYGDYDSNAARERIGMGLLNAVSLKKMPDKAALRSLMKYEEYIRREIFDEETGVVYNDAHRDNEWNRLYNYPWVSIFYLELYNLTGDKNYLSLSPLPLYSYYEQGGDNFYAIGIPAYELISALEKEKMTEESEKLRKLFLKHADVLEERGTDYPAHEVKFEQSIVAPAAIMLCDAYLLSDRKKYLTAAKKQIKILSLFASHVPDYHMYETAIRHWDGFWFGKNKLYGDTFPHYWSVLSGIAYKKYYDITGKAEYKKKSEDSFYGILPMFFEDGSASCAYVFPEYVNGVRAKKFDPVANDQDFGLYYVIKYGNRKAGE